MPKPRGLRIVLWSLRASSEEEITTEIKSLQAEPQRKILKIMETKTGEYVNEEDEATLENETRSFYTPT